MTDIQLPISVIEFLKEYRPVNPHFTSEDEINKIVKHLLIENFPAQYLRKIRNEIVEVYTKWMDQEIMFDVNGNYKGRTDKFYQYLEAMQSVTAVIDHRMYMVN